MEGKQQVTNKRQLKLINAVKSNDDIFENSLETTSRNLQIINHQDKDENNNDYLYVDHLKDFFENEMGAYYVPNEVSNASIVRHFCSQMKTDDPFYIVDLSYFTKRYLQWCHYLPRIQPYYAIKCNPNEFIIKTLAHENIGFDCASADELDLVLKTCPDINCEEKIIYSHPCKPISHIKYFRQHHVQMTVVDNEDELFKIKEYWPDAKVLLRLKIINGNSMSTKFGANQYQIIKLLKLAKQLNINLVGCSFHVGSQCEDRNLYEQTLQFARRIFDLAKTEEYGGFKFTILDIGGGFPVQFTEVAQMIRDMIDKLFPEEEGIHLMSEPGRYFTSESTMLICNIIARRTHNKDYSSEEELESNTQIMKEDDEKYLIRNAEILYYINDGIYGTFNAIIFDQKLFFVNYMRKDMKRENEEEEEQEYKSVLFGPTCDGIDCIANSISLPLLNIGDYLWFSNVGSYTNSCASNFNGFKIKKYFFIWKS